MKRYCAYSLHWMDWLCCLCYFIYKPAGVWNPLSSLGTGTGHLVIHSGQESGTSKSPVNSLHKSVNMPFPPSSGSMNLVSPVQDMLIEVVFSASYSRLKMSVKFKDNTVVSLQSNAFAFWNHIVPIIKKRNYFSKDKYLYYLVFWFLKIKSIILHIRKNIYLIMIQWPYRTEPKWLLLWW